MFSCGCWYALVGQNGSSLFNFFIKKLRTRLEKLLDMPCAFQEGVVVTPSIQTAQGGKQETCSI